MMFKEVIESVPNYREFMYINELNESSRKLAEKYSDIVELFKIGKSTRGEDIYALKVGEGENKAILIGFPHPNEPIGSLTCEYLSWRIAEDEKLRKTLDFTWYFVKAADIDGAKLNEGWFKGEYDTIKHVLNYYRTPSDRQIEWTFPIKYKNFEWNKPAPETKALMNLIDKVKPDLVYPLHNSAFGGVYFYVSDPCPSLYPKLHKLVESEELPLHLGEPEAPYMKKLADAIFYFPSFKEVYDFYERHSDKDPISFIKHGGSSKDYVKQASDAFLIICEMPYIFDERIVDTSPTNVSRRDTNLQGIKYWEDIYEFIKENFEETKNYLNTSSPFYEAIYRFLETFKPLLEAERKWAETDESLNRPATVSELFDNQVITKYYSMRIMGEFIRLLDGTVKKSTSPSKKLIATREKSYNKLLKINDEFQKEANIKVIPIQKLVRVQVGVALYAADFVQKEYRNR